MKKFCIYDCHYNANTMNYGGLEWVVDGERGRYTYPGTMPECLAKRLYAEGQENPRPGYCDGCVGTERYCRKH